jgi:hypothetical protein
MYHLVLKQFAIENHQFELVTDVTDYLKGWHQFSIPMLR